MASWNSHRPLDTGPDEGTSCAGSEKWVWAYKPRSPCDLLQITPKVFPPWCPLPQHGQVTEYGISHRELCHENECVGSSKTVANYVIWESVRNMYSGILHRVTNHNGLERLKGFPGCGTFSAKRILQQNWDSWSP